MSFSSKNFGVIAGLFRSFLIALTAIISKYLLYFDPHEILLYRSLAASLFQLSYLSIQRRSYSFRHLLKPEFLIYGSLCCICSNLFIYALKLNSFSDAMILCHTSPFFSFLIEIFIKKERFVFKELAYILVTFLGIMIISSDSYDFSMKKLNFFNLSYNHAVCLAQAALTAVRVGFEKKIAGKNQEITLNLASLASYLIYGLLTSLYLGYLRIPDSKELSLLVLLGFLIIVSESLFIISLKQEKASIMLMIQSSRMFMSFFLEVLFLQTYPKVSNIVVSIIIYFSIVTMMK